MCYVITLATHAIITHANKAPSNWHVRVGEWEAVKERRREGRRTHTFHHPFCTSAPHQPPAISPRPFLFHSSLSQAPFVSSPLCPSFRSFCPQLLPLPPHLLLPWLAVTCARCPGGGQLQQKPFGITKALLNLSHLAYFGTLLKSGWMGTKSEGEESGECSK